MIKHKWKKGNGKVKNTTKFSESLYKNLWKLSLPIALQNIFSTAVSSADVVMVGAVGQHALSAVSLAGQVQFVLNLIYLGLTLGTSLMAAQYCGRKDWDMIENILAFALKISVSVSAVFCILACFFSRQLMILFTSDLVLVQYGVTYLRLAGISYLFMGVSQIYQAVLKAAGQTGKSALISSATLLLNLIFNAIFIFGLFGIPFTGVAGAALGTLLARGIEMAWCLLDSVWGKTVQIRWGRIFRRDKLLAKDFWKYTLPITLNGLSWGSAFASYSIIMGHLGSDVVAANSIATVARNFAMAGCNGLAAGAGIYLGALLGQDKFDEARTDSGKIMRLTLGMGVVGGILILLFQPFLLGISDLTPMAEQYLRMMIFINAAYVITQSINTMLNNGVFCAGGDTHFGLICDTIDMWCFSVPLGFICAFVLKLPPMAVYMVLCLDEGAKMPFMLGHYRKNKWLKNITIKMEEETHDNG